ncbi:hypothetical protein MKW98_020355 [Papaver atlanticum]|uniref:FHA domain-containing protein n=1 Tax=Papaver atlanticum TaxID=357466 RepID=A0AAD4RWF4_9MAGN|nr:hypothetical protein MKW98_020355 [Papaver atlanticum]
MSQFQRERSSARRKRSPITRSLIRTNSSHKTRSLKREKYKSSSRGGSSRECEGRQYKSNKEENKERQKKKGGDTEGDKGYREISGDGKDPRDIRERMSKEINNVGNSRSATSSQPRQVISNFSPTWGSRRRAHDKVEDHRGFKAGNVSYLHMDAGDISVTRMKAEKSTFELSGKLAEKLIILFISDACIPVVRWRLYVLKGGEVINEPLYIHRKTCYLFERERRVADIPTDHSSCSKQHVVIHYWLVEKEQPDGMLKKKVRKDYPYIINLGSMNGTFINIQYLSIYIEAQRYYEPKKKIIQLNLAITGTHPEYVVLHENVAY